MEKRLKMLKSKASLVCLMFSIGCQTLVTYKEHPKYDLPFAESAQVDRWILLSGQIGIDDTKEKPQLVSGGIREETKQIMRVIGLSLQRQNCTMDNIVKCTIMMKDMKDWQQMNEEYLKFFPNHKPLRSAFGTSGLAFGAAVEIECLAYKP